MGFWYRRAASSTIRVSSTSKCTLNQWVPPNGLVSDLYIPSALYSQVQNFTGTSQADLLNQYNTALNNYSNAQVNIFVQRRNALEQQAYQVSDAIDPKYMIQLCGRTF